MIKSEQLENKKNTWGNYKKNMKRYYKIRLLDICLHDLYFRVVRDGWVCSFSAAALSTLPAKHSAA